jgi:hypothetical protein
MKKIVLVLVALLISANAMHAQAALFALLFGDKVASENFNVSLEIGGTFPAYSNIDNNSNMGINFGIGGNLKLSENWYLSPNIYFLAKRNFQLDQFSLNSGNTGLDAQFMNAPTDISLSYIDVPIFIAYQTNNKKYRFSLAPQLSFLQKSRALFSSTEGEFTQNFDGYTEDFDYGIMADVGYILGKAHKGKGVHIHVRYYYGLTDILKDQLSTSENRSNYLSLHLSFPFITDELAEKNLKDN